MKIGFLTFTFKNPKLWRGLGETLGETLGEKNVLLQYRKHHFYFAMPQTEIKKPQIG